MPNDQKFRIRLVFKEEIKPYLLDISSLLYDFELLHDFSLLICAEQYEKYKFTRFFWYRNGRPLKSEHKIRTYRILKQSPLTVELTLSYVVIISGAFWAMIQTIDKISNWQLNRERLKLEIEKLKEQSDIAYYEEEKAKVELDRAIYEREASKMFITLLRRIENNPITLEDIEVLGIEDKEFEEKRNV